MTEILRKAKAFICPQAKKNYAKRKLLVVLHIFFGFGVFLSMRLDGFVVGKGTSLEITLLTVIILSVCIRVYAFFFV